MITILGAFAQFEHAIRRERQMDGIARAKAEDRARKGQGLVAETYRCRPASIEAGKMQALKAQGMGATAIARRLKIGRVSVSCSTRGGGGIVRAK